jgi:hypothetical protein
MKYYTGFNAMLNGDDFMTDRMTIVKTFDVGGIRYRLWYVTDRRIITIVKSKGIQQIEYCVSPEMMDDCYGDGVEMACRQIIDFEFPEIIA